MILQARTIAFALSVVACVSSARAQFSDFARQTLRLYYAGYYSEAEEYGLEVLDAGYEDPNVVTAIINAKRAQGKYAEAADVASLAAKTFEGYIPIQVKAIETLRTAGRVAEADELLDGLDALAKTLNPKTLNATELTGLGKAALLLGAEPKMVHTQFFKKARAKEPENLEAALAAGQLAIDKGDYALAAKILGEARNKIGPVPDILYLLAKAQSASDREAAEKLIDLALERNAKHVPSLLLRAEHAYDAEKYDRAEETLAAAKQINPNHPLAWAFSAAMGYIEDKKDAADSARAKALEPWGKNPEVDYLIGRKISQKRRFEEGSEFLRRALEFAPEHHGARKTLGQNLLRLGLEDEGWALLKAAQADDKYDVELFNLMLLRDELDKFEILNAKGFMVRMTPEEAAVYGDRVVEVLEQAQEKLGEKYGFTPPGEVVIDFFPDQQDFAVRMLGMPGGLGIVGACFGNVVAMNSPGSPGAMSTNWESTLWHEYCHTITLGATRNRIPRWFTEGISVYEEQQRDPACGHKMTSEFRERILGEGGLIPIADLSGALTAFNDPETISFAYYQSSVLVDYMVQTFGAQSIKDTLASLKIDADVEKALAANMAKLDIIEAGFAKFAKAKASEVGADADWERPENEKALSRDPDGLTNYLTKNPNNIWGLIVHINYLLADQKWQAAKATSDKLINLYPQYIGPGNGYASLARARRNLNDAEGEAAALEALAERDSDSSDAFLRLIELGLSDDDWPLVRTNARRQLALNPMLREPHRALGLAAQAENDRDDAIEAFESLLALDPANPADAHFRLAQLQSDSDPKEAKRHLLEAIEDAPRFRSAHRLLLELK